MNKPRGPLALLLILALLLGTLSACSMSQEDLLNVIAPTAAPQDESSAGPEGEEVISEEPPEVVPCEKLTGVFNPLYAVKDGDKLVAEYTQLPLQGFEGGESPSTVTAAANDDGTYTVSIELKGGVFFSDGVPVNADDLLFTIYALYDSSYDGPTSLADLPILGAEEYRWGVTAEMHEKYGELFDEIYDDGHYDEALQDALKEAKNAKPHDSWVESQAQKALDEYDTEKADAIRETILLVWKEDTAALTSYCMEKFSGTIPLHTPFTREEVEANPGLQIMFAMVESGFGQLNEEGILVGQKTGSTWDLKTAFPTEDDFFTEMYETYGGDALMYWQLEGIGRGDLMQRVRDRLVAEWATEDKDYTGPVLRLSGIERVGDRLITVTFPYRDDTYVNRLLDIYLVPMHVYGNESGYDYSAGNFGFPKGDLSSVRANNSLCVGAGSYVLSSFEGGMASLKRSTTCFTEITGAERVHVQVPEY